MLIKTALSFFLLVGVIQNAEALENAEISICPSLMRLDTLPSATNYALKLSEAALSLTKDKVLYDPTYFSIPYPGGDVPTDRGVCTDVIVRAYRKMGTDLQKMVHEDMVKNFALYPKKWGLKKTDTNIDHRRVPNLMIFFARHGIVKKLSQNPQDYQPGDIVTWNLGGGLTHIGLVVNRKSADKQRYLIVHNIGNGQELSDCLFSFTLTGHYGYVGR
jgi:uncharacterized protein YijF (DUF1287 family)